MTREEAIERLKEGEPFSEIFDSVWDEALNMAIKALEKEPCDDCSIKYELEVNLKKWADAYKRGLKDGHKEPILDKIRAEINSPNRGTCDYFIVDRIEEIIDKYTAEREEE